MRTDTNIYPLCGSISLSLSLSLSHTVTCARTHGHTRTDKYSRSPPPPPPPPPHTHTRASTAYAHKTHARWHSKSNIQLEIRFSYWQNICEKSVSRTICLSWYFTTAVKETWKILNETRPCCNFRFCWEKLKSASTQWVPNVWFNIWTD